MTGTKIRKYGHCMQQQSHCRLTAKNCVIIYYTYCVLDRGAPGGSTNEWCHNTMKDLLLQNTVSQKDEKLHTVRAR